MRTNDANNYIVGQISRTVFSEVRTAASTKASRSFLDRIFISFSDIHGKTVQESPGWALNAHGVYDSHIPECFSVLHFSEQVAR